MRQWSRHRPTGVCFCRLLKLCVFLPVISISFLWHFRRVMLLISVHSRLQIKTNRKMFYFFRFSRICRFYPWRFVFLSCNLLTACWTQRAHFVSFVWPTKWNVWRQIDARTRKKKKKSNDDRKLEFFDVNTTHNRTPTIRCHCVRLQFSPSSLPFFFHQQKKLQLWRKTKWKIINQNVSVKSFWFCFVSFSVFICFGPRWKLCRPVKVNFSKLCSTHKVINSMVIFTFTRSSNG